MTSKTAAELRYLVERSAFRDTSLTDEDRSLAFDIAIRGLRDEALDWLMAKMARELAHRGRGPTA